MKNPDLFEALALEDSEEQERRAGTRAVIACQERAIAKFGNFVGASANDLETVERLAFVGDDLEKVVVDVASEYEFTDLEKLRNAATVALGGGHPSGCECGFCKNKGKLPGQKEDTGPIPAVDDDHPDNDTGDEDEKFESSVKVAEAPDDAGDGGDARDEGSEAMKDDDESDGAPDAAGKGGEYRDKLKKQEKDLDGKGGPATKEAAGPEPADGDTSWQERVDVDSGPDASPKIDKSQVPAGGLQVVQVPSEVHPNESQAVDDKPDFDAKLPDPSETGKRVDADTPIGSEETGNRTETWGGDQAEPVTSSEHTAMAVSKRDFEAIAAILKQNGSDPAIATQIAEYFGTQNPRFDEQRFMDAAGQAMGPITGDEYGAFSSVHSSWQVVEVG